MKLASTTSYAVPYNYAKLLFWRWLLWFSVIAIIITVSLLNYEPIKLLLNPPHDKIIHVLVFFGFLVFTKLLFKNLSFLTVCIITFSLGLLTELLQKFFTHGIRQFDAYDVLFNLIGIALGLLLLMVYKGVEKGKQANAGT